MTDGHVVAQARWRRRAAVAVLVLGVAAVPLALSLGVDNRLERWVSQDPEQEARYRQLRATFGSDELMIVAISGGNVLGQPALDAMAAAVGRLEAIPGVVRVEGPPVLFRDVFGGEDAELLRLEVTETPFYRNLFVSDDGDVVGVLLELDPPAGPRGRHDLVAAIRRAVAPLEGERGLEVRLVGSTALIVALDEVSERESRRSLPLATGLSVVILMVTLRSLAATVAAAVSCGVTVALTLGAMRLTGTPLTMVTGGLPALLFVLALSNAIHVLTRYQRARVGAPAVGAMSRALAGATRPCAVAALTTALGFLALLTAGMAPVRELGLFAALGLVISLAVNLTVVPALAVWLGVRARAALLRDRESGGLAPRRPWLALAVTAVACAVAAALIPSIRVQSNPLRFLPASHGTVRDYAFVGERLTGFHTLEVVVATPAGFLDPATWPVLDGLAERLAGSSAVARVLSPLDLLRLMVHVDSGFDPEVYRLPGSGGEARRLVDGLAPEQERAMAALSTTDGRTVRLSVIVHTMQEEPFLELAATARAAVQALPPGYSGFVTGQVARLVTSQKALVSSQIRSLGLALVVVLAAIWVGLRSLRLTAVSVLPNLLPGVATFGAMGALAIPLDAGTVMVASVALGIAVDNTIHLLADYRARRRGGVAHRAAADGTVAALRPAMVATTVTSCIGFAALTVSEFRPIFHFGVLAAWTMVVALAADLWLTPALVLLFGRGRGEVERGTG